MALNLGSLLRQAEEAYRWRGHADTDWMWLTRQDNQEILEKTCPICGAWVQVNTKPAPNQIDIGGPAVAIHCTKGE